MELKLPFPSLLHQTLVCCARYLLKTAELEDLCQADSGILKFYHANCTEAVCQIWMNKRLNEINIPIYLKRKLRDVLLQVAVNVYDHSVFPCDDIGPLFAFGEEELEFAHREVLVNQLGEVHEKSVFESMLTCYVLRYAEEPSGHLPRQFEDSVIQDLRTTGRINDLELLIIRETDMPVVNGYMDEETITVLLDLFLQTHLKFMVHYLWGKLSNKKKREYSKRCLEFATKWCMPGLVCETLRYTDMQVIQEHGLQILFTLLYFPYDVFVLPVFEAVKDSLNWEQARELLADIYNSVSSQRQHDVYRLEEIFKRVFVFYHEHHANSDRDKTFFRDYT